MKAMGVALLIGWLIAAQGCVLPTALIGPASEQREVFERDAKVEVRSLPAGGVVRDADGSERATPTEVTTHYRVRRTGKKYRMWTMFAATILSVTIGTVALAARDPDKMDQRLDFGDDAELDAIAVVFLLDAFLAVSYGPRWARHNGNWRKHARTEVIPAPLDIAVAWQGWTPVTTRVNVPEDRYVTARRPTLGSFDEALIHWQRTSGLVPSPVGMLNLGHAYAALVAAGGDAYRDIAIDYYEQFLATGQGTPEQRATAHRQLAHLRRRTGADQ